ncbi:beta-sarcoglycan isoform X2 [Diaphorina citri]|uniref:Beta-sarcoglycan n=1 Tax=Diaphorina citri TaxID=121845 RepID=A0A3Q0JH47_DIACI|nr:beta-sarcoglycan isoform X1 [Diaphorina citri]XP_026686061.1 beta-sarcoglycan isoform X2 [Diaphorina citri]
MESDIDVVGDEVKINKLSIRDKMLLKRNFNRLRHSENFQAGRVIEDPGGSPSHTGLHDGKSFTFWALIGLLYLFALINLVLTLTLMTMLRIGWGMETIEMLPLLNMVKLYGDIDLGKLYKDDGYFSSFKDSGLRITGRQGGSVHIDVNFGVNRTRRMLSIEPEGVRVTNVKEFNVYDPTDHLPIFSTGFRSADFGLPRGVKKLDVQQVRTSRIISPIEDDLTLRSETYTRLKGNEGISMEGRTITWTADKDIFLKSVNGSLTLAAENGIFLEVKKLPFVKKNLFLDSNLHNAAFKLCVCMPGGRIFRVKADDIMSHNACHNINTSPEHHPCR